MKRLVRTTVLAAALCGACSSSRPRPSPAAGPPLLPRSSVVAVLDHRDELTLDEQQVKALEQVQQNLDRKNDQTRKEFGERRTAGATDSSGGRDRTQHRRHGGGSAGDSGGSRSSRSSARATSPSSLERALDANDTDAFLEAETLLRETQRDRAREIAESYRESLYDWRERRRSGSER